MTPFQSATRPTLYFIGVSTGQSSILKVFPQWAAHLGLDAAIVGIDFPLHADPAAYRAAIEFIRDDPLSCGALVTTHKLDLFAACRGLFGRVDNLAALMNEVSCISKRDGLLVAHAKDPISSGLTLDAFLPADHFAHSGADVFAIGAGGSAIAITWHLMRHARGANVPRRIVVSDRDQARLDDIAHIHAAVETTAQLDYVLAQDPLRNDALVTTLRPGSLIINATGLGKDAPGSPLTNSVTFPDRAIAWDLNYRGDLLFLEQARAQSERHRLQLEDGWAYFIYGWTQVIGEVFAIEMPAAGPPFEALARIASNATKAA